MQNVFIEFHRQRGLAECCPSVVHQIPSFHWTGVDNYTYV